MCWLSHAMIDWLIASIAISSGTYTNSLPTSPALKMDCDDGDNVLLNARNFCNASSNFDFAILITSLTPGGPCALVQAREL